MVKISSNNQAAKTLLSSLDGLFYQGQVFLLPHQHLTFVCGARPDPEGKDESLRTQFLDYLKVHSPSNSILPILAEKAIGEFLGSGVNAAVELGKFENLIADCVDSILIFPESPGSYAELGFFAANPGVLKKTLIANKDRFQGNSFINLGLIPIYDRDSIYKPMIVLSVNLQNGFEQIVERLELKNSQVKIYKKRFSITTFKSLTPKQQLIVLYELIRVFVYITEENLFSVIKHTFKSYDLDVVHRLLAILFAMNYIDRNEYGDYVIKKDAPSLLEYSGNAFEKAKSQTMLFYKKHDAAAFEKVENL